MAGGAVVEINKGKRASGGFNEDEVRRTEAPSVRISSNGGGRDVGRLVMRSSASAGSSSRDNCGEGERINGGGIEGRRQKEEERRNTSNVLKYQQEEGDSAYWTSSMCWTYEALLDRLMGGGEGKILT